MNLKKTKKYFVNLCSILFMLYLLFCSGCGKNPEESGKSKSPTGSPDNTGKAKTISFDVLAEGKCSSKKYGPAGITMNNGKKKENLSGRHSFVIRSADDVKPFKMKIKRYIDRVFVSRIQFDGLEITTKNSSSDQFRALFEKLDRMKSNDEFSDRCVIGVIDTKVQMSQIPGTVRPNVRKIEKTAKGYEVYLGQKHEGNTGIALHAVPANPVKVRFLFVRTTDPDSDKQIDFVSRGKQIRSSFSDVILQIINGQLAKAEQRLQSLGTLNALPVKKLGRRVLQFIRALDEGNYQLAITRHWRNIWGSTGIWKNYGDLGKKLLLHLRSRRDGLMKFLERTGREFENTSSKNRGGTRRLLRESAVIARPVLKELTNHSDQRIRKTANKILKRQIPPYWKNVEKEIREDEQKSGK